jgi:hypothetical protein
MTAPNHKLQFTTTRRGISLVLAGALLVAVGCKHKDGGLASGPSKGPDPLVAGPGKIPKQNLPLPDRGLAGGKKGDPLLGSPTGKTGPSGYTDDPERWKGGPHIPGAGSTPAALAGWNKSDPDGLKIETPGVPLRPAGGSLPPESPSESSVPAIPTGGGDPWLGELATVYGVKRGDYSLTRSNGQFELRVNVPWSNGTTRQITGTGPTESAAVQQVVEQIKADRRK